jgi:hypothetical protein
LVSDWSSDVCSSDLSLMPTSEKNGKKNNWISVCGKYYTQMTNTLQMILIYLISNLKKPHCLSACNYNLHIWKIKTYIMTFAMKYAQ